MGDHYKSFWFEGEQLSKSLIQETEEMEAMSNEEEGGVDIASSDEDKCHDDDDQNVTQT